MKCVEHKPVLCEITKDAFVTAKTPQGFTELPKISEFNLNTSLGKRAGSRNLPGKI